MTTSKPKIGFTKVYCGSMYSGKTRRLLDDLERLQYAKQTFQLFKPDIDTRYGIDTTTTHTKTNTLSSTRIPIDNPSNILDLVLPKTDVVGIDEIQFFDISILDVIHNLEQKGKRIITSGLDMYATGEPWPVTQRLLCTAKYIEKVHAVCLDCGDDAYYSYALDKDINSANQINLGSTEKYIPLCQTCAAIRKSAIS